MTIDEAISYLRNEKDLNSGFPNTAKAIQIGTGALERIQEARRDPLRYSYGAMLALLPSEEEQ